MMQVVFAGAGITAGLYLARVRDFDDIVALVGEDHLEALTIGEGLNMWFTPSTAPRHQCPNRWATAIFLARTPCFSASTVPLLRGDVVVAAYGGAGDIRGLSTDQFTAVTGFRTRGRAARILSRRCARDEWLHHRRMRALIEDANQEWTYGRPF